jgi:nucleoside triphosphate pyrophosphatase
MPNKLQIILASASPRRERLLREMGLRFTVVQPSNVEEFHSGAVPDVLAMQNAQRKVRAVAGAHPDAMIIGADTIVVLDGTIFGKPGDRNDAVRMLEQLAGRQHEVITGVCLRHDSFDTELTFADTTRVWMRPLTKKQIYNYFDKIDPPDDTSERQDCPGEWQRRHGFLSWAGAYAIQQGDIVDRIEGSYSNVMGLPTERLGATLERLGLRGSSDG